MNALLLLSIILAINKFMLAFAKSHAYRNEIHPNITQMDCAEQNIWADLLWIYHTQAHSKKKKYS